MRVVLSRGSLLVACLLFLTTSLAAADPLPTWRDDGAKQAIVAFVQSVSDPASPDFLPEAERIAVFDNDGTLWSEKPIYFQVVYALDRVRAEAEKDPAFAKTPALKAAVAGDMKTLMADHAKGMLEVLAVTHSGMSVGDYSEEVKDWLATARHPKTGKPYDQMVFQPMLELLSYLRDQGFATYIVSGGGTDFMRTFAGPVYGIPPQQVIGSAGKASYQVIDGIPQITKDAGIFFVDDKDGKPLGIHRKIGRRPVFAAGNSDGDLEMLQWTTTGQGPRFGMIVHHDDAEREWAYDRDSDVGRLDKALDMAGPAGWLLVSMKDDWAKIYAWDAWEMAPQ